jgi:hypothetical protein
VPNTSILFGVLLILLGLWGYFGTGTSSPTALIPAAFGLLLVIAGVLAQAESRRKHAMHAAAMVGVLGFLGSVNGWANIGAVLSGAEVPRKEAVIATSIMALLCLIFTGLCVRSFIAARRARTVA